MTTYYKFLKEDGSCIFGNGKWHLPSGKRPGKWMPKIEELEMCVSGYHVTTKKHLLDWLGPKLFEVEVRGDTLSGDKKSVWQQARLVKEITTWNDNTARQFAIECAERVLPIFKKEHPDDKRPREAIETVKAFLKGEATEEELATAWEAARGAARSAAGDAGNAAYAAAWASRSAPRYAVWDAARAARGAARSAASAASDAAWDAAWAAKCAELEWQQKRLWELLEV